MQDQSSPESGERKRGRPKGIKDTKPRQPRQPLPESITCEICGLQVKPKTRRQRFCSQACYQRWWLVRVRPKATDAGIASIKQAIAEGRGRTRDEHGAFYTENKGPRYRPYRKPDAPSNLEIVHTQRDDDDPGWAERAAYWEEMGREAAPRNRTFGLERPEPRSLVLNGHGIRLHVHQGSLVIRNGFTHYPQVNPELRFFPGDKKLPSRIIVLDSDGSISFDVIAWLSEQGVPLVLLNWRGEVVSVIGDGQGPYDPDLRAAQYGALTNGVGLRLATELIRKKIEGCRETLQTFWKSPDRDVALVRQEIALEELAKGPSSVEDLRLIEARAAFAYFTAWQEQPIRWKGIGRKPIPDDWYRCTTRQGVLGKTNRHASHPVNAMLNYAYAFLESQIRMSAIAEGLDPTVGYLHSIHPSRSALLYDLMEPLRPAVDRHVLELVRTHKFAPTDFVRDARGECRLHPVLARQVVQSLGDDLCARTVAEQARATLAAAEIKHTACSA